MRSRKDFSKDFELVVKQEIKNYNDTVLTTNMALEKAKKSVEDLSKSIDLRIASIESKLTLQGSDISKLKAFVDNSSAQLSSRIGDQDQKIDKNINYLESSLKGIQSNYQEKNAFEEVMKDVKKQISGVFQSINQLEDGLLNDIQRSSLRSQENLDKLRKEILEKPSETIDLKADLEKQIGIAAVNASGIMRELALYKRSVMVIEKNIENIYTQIDRIRGL